MNGGVPDARMDGMEIFESVQERKIKKGLKQTGANRCQAGNESRKRQGSPKANIENKPGKGGSKIHPFCADRRKSTKGKRPGRCRFQIRLFRIVRIRFSYCFPSMKLTSRLWSLHAERHAPGLTAPFPRFPFLTDQGLRDGDHPVLLLPLPRRDRGPCSALPPS